MSRVWKRSLPHIWLFSLSRNGCWYKFRKDLVVDKYWTRGAQGKLSGIFHPPKAPWWDWVACAHSAVRDTTLKSGMARMGPNFPHLTVLSFFSSPPWHWAAGLEEERKLWTASQCSVGKLLVLLHSGEWDEAEKWEKLTARDRSTRFGSVWG